MVRLLTVPGADRCGTVAAINDNQMVEISTNSQPAIVVDERNQSTIVVASYSDDGNLLLIVTESKNVTVLRRPDHPSQDPWQQIFSGTCFKRATAASFSSQKAFTIADKAGDLYRYEIGINQSPELIAGHVSMLTSVSFCAGGTRIVSADRDNKIRISMYPRAWNIHGFCLGHTEFITSVISLGDAENLLISASGDGTIRLWNCDSCAQVDIYNLQEGNADGGRIRGFSFSIELNALAASIDNSRGIDILAIHQQKLVHVSKVYVHDAVESIAFAMGGLLWVALASGEISLFILEKTSSVPITCQPLLLSEHMQSAIRGMSWLSRKDPARIDLKDYMKQSGDFGAGEYFDRKQARLESKQKSKTIEYTSDSALSSRKKINRNKRARIKDTQAS